MSAHPRSTEETSQRLLEERVSSRSLWRDDVWFLDDPNPAVTPSSRKVDWNFTVATGVRFADPRCASLLRTCKTLFGILLKGSIEVRPLKAGTIMPLYQYLKLFVRWMVEHQIERFSDLSREQILQYRAFVAERTKPRSLEPASTRPDGVTQGEKTALLPLRHLIRHAAELGDAPRLSLREADELLLATSTAYRGEGVQPIPPAISGALYETALTWIREHGPKIIELRSATNAAHQEARYRSKSYRQKVARSHYERLAGDHIIQTSHKRVFLGDVSLVTFNMLVVYLETACYIVVAGLTGMRVSELFGLDIDCLRTRATTDDRHLLVLQSRLIKMRVAADGDRLEWVAGWDTEDNPVRAAVNILSQLGVEHRAASGLNNLFVSGSFTIGKWCGDDASEPRIFPMSHNQMNKRINAFAEFVGLPDAWHFTTHQFRMTFARYVATKDWTGLQALKRHFKHVSLQMTNVYAGNDHELHELIADYRNDFTKSLLDKVLGAQALGGRLGQEIVNANQQFRGDAGAMARAEVVEAIAENSDLLLLPHEYGFCVYRQPGALCDGQVSLIGLDSCVRCPNFVVTRENQPFWEERRESIQQLRNDPIMVGASKDQTDALWREQELADEVLANLQ